MPTKVILTITEGNLKGQEFEFFTRTTCIIGRADECQIQIPDTKEYSTISRYHCLLDINPPDIRVRDFGSRNGTYVNGDKIGQRLPNQTPEEAIKVKYAEYDLKKGDEIKLSNIVLKVGIKKHIESAGTLDIAKAKINPAPVPDNQFNFWEFAKNLIKRAKAGEKQLTAIRNYSLLKLIGKGGFGEVYLAQHDNTGEFVALKIMLPEVAANQRAIDYFLRETENTKALKHPNIVELRDYGYFDGKFYFTMEYCNGGSITNLMQRQGGKLSIDEAIPIILQVLDGLEYAHNAAIPNVRLADGTFGKGRGLVHRDIKPDNIFLINAGNQRIVKIGDYGLGKAFDFAGLSGQTMTGDKAGSPYFMPRQQVIDFKYAKPEVDVWATAACLYNMLTGGYPRDFSNNADPFLTVLQQSAMPIRVKDKSIPKELGELIDLALVDKPEIYFKSAGEFKQALLNVL
ncbi:MAG: protein kinase [Crinalium sp.]